MVLLARYYDSYEIYSKEIEEIGRDYFKLLKKICNALN